MEWYEELLEITERILKKGIGAGAWFIDHYGGQKAMEKAYERLAPVLRAHQGFVMEVFNREKEQAEWILSNKRGCRYAVIFLSVSSEYPQEVFAVVSQFYPHNEDESLMEWIKALKNNERLPEITAYNPEKVKTMIEVVKAEL